MKKWISRGLTVAVSAFVLLLGLNLLDDSLKPEVKDLLDQQVQVTPEALAAFKYFLGFGSEDPQAEGEKIYAALKSNSAPPEGWRQWPDKMVPFRSLGNFIPKGILDSPREHFRKIPADNKFFVDHARHLYATGGMASDIPLNRFTTYPESSLIKLWNLDSIRISALIADGKNKEALEELKSIFAFHEHSLQGHVPMVGIMIRLSVLKRVRQFVADAAHTTPAFMKVLAPDDFTAHIDIDALVATAQKSEAEYVSDMLAHFTDIAAAGTSANEKRLVRFVNYTPNRLMNAHYDCWKNGSPSPLLVIYPFTRFVVKATCEGIAHTKRRLIENAASFTRRLPL